MSQSLVSQIHERYPWLGDFTVETAHAFVHDVVAVITEDRRYALKLYRVGVRSVDDLQWEVALTSHLDACGAPVVRIVDGRSGPVENLEVDGVVRSVVMSEWAPGVKPSSSEKVQRLVGRAAASIHNAADSYVPEFQRAPLGVDRLLTDQVALLRQPLEVCGRWDDVEALVWKLRQFTMNGELDWGVCHNDLTLDNVHINRDSLYVFDFDSARPTWRALEPALLYGGHIAGKRDCHWQAWLDGYREVRDLADVDLRAIPLFSIMYQFENVAWKLGLTPTAVGLLLTPEQLPQIVDDWLAQYELATR